MGSIQHANAKTTIRVRKEIQESKESIAALAQRFSLNPKTVLKWRHAGRVEDAKSGPTNPRSKVLTALEEQIICEFRRVTKFPLDDVLLALRDKIPALKRGNLLSCLKRHGLNRLPDDEEKPAAEKQKFADYDIGFVHIDITEIRLEQQKYYLFVGIDRICKYAYIELHEHMTQEISVAFLKNLIKDFPFNIHRILTDNGAQFTYKLLAEHLQPKNKLHPFDAICEQNNIKHKLTKFRHPWTNGQVEIMNKKIKNHTTKKYHYDDVEQLKKHLMAFLMAYNFQRPLRALKFKSPYDSVIEWWKQKPALFKINPHQKIAGLNI